MIKILLLQLLLIVFFYGCHYDNNKSKTTEKNSSFESKQPLSLLIAPVYLDTVYFVVQANIKKQTLVKGNVEGFHDKTTEIHELYFQRFVEKQGTYRIIHAVGTGLETINEYEKEQYKLNRFNDTIKFDELGIFAGEPGDPIDLIPLYPGHTVKPGEFWKPEAKVKIPMGYGVAKYRFVIDSLYKDKKGSVLVRMQIQVNGDLQPSSEFHGGKVVISGGGWIVWDCTINQRRESHLQATYLAIKGQTEVKQFISVDDKLQVNKGRKEF
jgi:hypothetical protein